MFLKQREQMRLVMEAKKKEQEQEQENDDREKNNDDAPAKERKGVVDGEGENEEKNLSDRIQNLDISDGIDAAKSKNAENKSDPIKESKEILPPLFGRIDPDTLLARLNTRRLYQRLAHYRKEERRKKKMAQENECGDIGNEGAKTSMEDQQSIIQYYEKDLREKMQADRLYPKNVTVEEMADMEWNNLLKLASLRNGGNQLPHDPIPTQFELLLFSSCPRAVAVLASYPRSGNSLMRTLYEHTTLRVTGSDMQGGLAKHDLVGEMAVTTNKVQFVKTHYPERRGTPPFQASRAVLLVRNPFDAIDSFFNLMMTGTHTTSISNDIREKTTQVWEEFVLKEIRVWKKFHLYWLNQDIPLLLIRYEDLIRRPDRVMERVIQFVLEIQRMGSFFGERIDRCIREQEEIERLGSYKPRSGGIGKAFSKYSSEILKELQDLEFIMLMERLGYGSLMRTPWEKWAEMSPLKDHGIEYLPSTSAPEGGNIVVLNKGELARGPKEQTNWRKIKVELGIVENKCSCERCKSMSKR